MLYRDIKAIGRMALSILTGTNNHVFQKKDKTMNRVSKSYLSFIKNIALLTEMKGNKFEQIIKL